MNPEVAAHLEKARRLLSQAQALDADAAPEAIAHLSYYAMFHAATAVLIARGPTPARTHQGVIGAFGRLVKDLGADPRSHGKALNRAQDLRLLADYGAQVPDLEETSAASRADAQRFVDYCERVLQDP